MVGIGLAGELTNDVKQLHNTTEQQVVHNVQSSADVNQLADIEHSTNVNQLADMHHTQQA